MTELHAHRFILDQNGPTTTGVCTCGATKTFANGLNVGVGKEAHRRVMSKKPAIQESDGYVVFPTRSEQRRHTR